MSETLLLINTWDKSCTCTEHQEYSMRPAVCPSREIYHHSSSPTAPPSSSAAKKTSEQEAKKAQPIEFCGIAFGAGAHLSVTVSDGSLIPFLLRPHASSGDHPDSVLVPMALLMLRPDGQAKTGVANPTIITFKVIWAQATEGVCVWLHSVGGWRDP